LELCLGLLSLGQVVPSPLVFESPTPLLLLRAVDSQVELVPSPAQTCSSVQAHGDGQQHHKCILCRDDCNDHMDVPHRIEACGLKFQSIRGVWQDRTS
jgi:hypothetical protein